jgi:V/A-type H+/Na+-transporting ATPase subunit C
MATGLDAIKYAASNARMRGLRTRLISENVWQQLLATENLGGAVEILLQTDYHEEVFEYGRGGTLELIERRLTGRAAQNCRKVMSLTSGPVRNLFFVWWQHFELENLKTIFRSVEQHVAPEVTKRLLIPLGELTTLPWDSLMQEQSVSSLVERLTGTHYINPLRNAFAAYQRENSLFPLEIALDVRYYRDIASGVRKLQGEERVDAQRIFGTRLDILNILWAYRHRIFYGLSVEEIVNYTLWQTFRTDMLLVREIALGAAPSDILRRVWGNAINLDLIESAGNDFQMMPKLELTLERFWRSIAVNEMGGYPFKLGSIIGYLVLEESEIRDLVTLLEGKGMDWSAERIRQNLLRRME